MKIPTVRQQETASQPGPIEPPLTLEITHTIEEKLQSYALQGQSYGLDRRGKTGLYSIIWIWICAVLAFAAYALDEIQAEGLYEFIRGFELIAVVPGLFILVAVTIGVLLWPRLAPYRTRKVNLSHLKRLGELHPVRMVLHVNGSGITITEQSGEARLLRWHEAVVFTEDERWLSFHVPMRDLNVVIPKRDVSDEEKARVRRWNEVRGRAGAHTEPTISAALAGREIARSSEYAPAKDDHVAMMMELANDRHWRRHHLKGHALVALGIALATPVFHVLVWAFDPHRLPVSIAWPLFLEMFATRFWIGALIGVAFLAIVISLQVPLRRFGARYYADQVLASWQGTALVVIGEKGVLDGDSHYLPWNAMRTFRISDDYLFITGRMGQMLAYPRHIFPAEKTDEIEILLRERAGKPQQQGDKA